MIPTPVFDTYWRFAAERQAMFFRRLENPAGPWTTDHILRCYRFTNAYRVMDRVSQYLVSEVQENPSRPQTGRELFFRTILFKIFNRIETWEAIESELGPLESDKTSLSSICDVLDRMFERGDRVYSAAYIMPAPPFGHKRKHANHLALLSTMINESLPDRLASAGSMAAAYELLLGYAGIGRFLAFQYVIDLNYSQLLDFDEADFVVAGPGALDGISKCFENAAELDAEDVIHWTTERQETEFKRLGLSFEGLFGRRLQPIDCQNLYCEISKYARVAHPEVKGVANRTRIKQSYTTQRGPIPFPVLPAKWNVDPPFCALPAHVQVQAPLQLQLL